MRLALVTDAWYPQVNGVVRTLDTVTRQLRDGGDDVLIVAPDRFRTVPCPTYPEIRLALFPGRALARLIDDFRPGAIHIATEGPLGWAARAYCRARGLPFTTAFHTRFPEYVAARFHAPVSWGYAVMRRFHAPAKRVMAANRGLMAELAGRGFPSPALWGRGVDTTLFRPRDDAPYDLPRPVFLFTGRVAVEKNIEAFIALDLPGTKLVVGDGPQRAALAKRYPDVVWAGYRQGEELARHYAGADVFVFPSRTDTFGLVLLEALACGVPVAAYPVSGPADVIGDAPVGALDEDLGRAARRALTLDRAACRAFAEDHTWAASARQFRANLWPFAGPWNIAA